MKKYKIYFELYKKKMVTEIKAESEQQAKIKLKELINIHKIEVINEKNDEDIFKKIFEILNWKK